MRNPFTPERNLYSVVNVRSAVCLIVFCTVICLSLTPTAVDSSAFISLILFSSSQLHQLYRSNLVFLLRTHTLFKSVLHLLYGILYALSFSLTLLFTLSYFAYFTFESPSSSFGVFMSKTRTYQLFPSAMTQT